jgi:hypothetical protein
MTTLARSRENQTNCFGTVPTDVAREIALWCGPYEINKMLQMNKSWNSSLIVDWFWREKLIKDFGISAVKGNDFLKLYQENFLGSWRDWVETSIVSAVKHCAGAGIYGLDGVLWGRSKEFRLLKGEIKEINKTWFSNTNIQINGETYIFIRSIDNSYTFRKGTKGCIIYKTKTAAIIAIFKDTNNAEFNEANTRIGKLSDDLVTQSY